MMKPFLTNKGHINGEEIILKCDNETITESSVLAEMFVQLTLQIMWVTFLSKPLRYNIAQY